MSALTEAIALALANGWTVADPNGNDGYGQAIEFRRPNPDDRRRTEYVWVTTDPRGAFTAAAWAPALDGIGARIPQRDRRAWVAEKLSRNAAKEKK